MMRRTAVALASGALLLGATVSLARMTPAMFGGTATAGSVSTDSCADGLLFSWHFENTDVTLGGVAGGVNNGCSAGDTTASATSGAVLTTGSFQDGSKSGSFPTAGDYYSLSISSDDIADDAAGTAIFYLKLNAAVATCGVFRIRYDGDNLIRLQTVGASANQLQAYYIGAATSRSYSTTTANLSTDGSTWYMITFKWSQAGVSEGGSTRYMSIQVNAATPEYYGTQPTALATTPTALVVGDYNGTTGCNLQVDNLKVYNSWLAL